MKKILLSLLTLTAGASAANAATLQSIDCIASNGVTITGKAVDADSDVELGGLPVVTRWGVIRKDFLATFAPTPDGKATINLSTDKGLEYQIAVNVNPNALGALKATGTILKPDLTTEAKAVVVAYVSCGLTLR
jgi:hypothetical protein